MELDAQKISQTGTSPSFTAADDAGDSFFNSGDVVLHIKNGGTSLITATIDSVEKCNQGYDHDLQVDVEAGAEKIVGPFPGSRFSDENRRTNISYSAVASVTVAAYRT